MILLGSSLERAIVNDMFLVFEVMKVKFFFLVGLDSKL